VAELRTAQRHQSSFEWSSGRAISRHSRALAASVCRCPGLRTQSKNRQTLTPSATGGDCPNHLHRSVNLAIVRTPLLGIDIAGPERKYLVAFRVGAIGGLTIGDGCTCLSPCAAAVVRCSLHFCADSQRQRRFAWQRAVAQRRRRDRRYDRLAYFRSRAGGQQRRWLGRIARRGGHWCLVFHWRHGLVRPVDGADR
jgi:hypothetical protein